MKKIFLMLSFFAVIFSSCTKERDMGLEGDYSGTFTRISSTAPARTANVNLKLEVQKFSGNSDQQIFPAICAGSWVKNKNTLKFSNTCMWTANFDWTLILEGEFEYSYANDRLILRKNYSLGNYDEYELKKN